MQSDPGGVVFGTIIDAVHYYLMKMAMNIITRVVLFKSRKNISTAHAD